MSKLSSVQRNNLPEGAFGIQRTRKFPMPDANHAQVAKGRATQGVNAGTLSSSEKATIDAKANRILQK